MINMVNNELSLEDFKGTNIAKGFVESSLSAQMDDFLEKGKALPIGTKKTYGGKPYIKTANGWRPEKKGGKGEGAENESSQREHRKEESKVHKQRKDDIVQPSVKNKKNINPFQYLPSEEDIKNSSFNIWARSQTFNEKQGAVEIHQDHSTGGVDKEKHTQEGYKFIEEQLKQFKGLNILDYCNSIKNQMSQISQEFQHLTEADGWRFSEDKNNHRSTITIIKQEDKNSISINFSHAIGYERIPGVKQSEFPPAFTVQRTFTVSGEDYNTITINHSAMEVPDQFQGQSVAAKLMVNQYKSYKQLAENNPDKNVHLTIEAGSLVGGYAWAKYGFSLDKTKEADRDFFKKEIAYKRSLIKKGKSPNLSSEDLDALSAFLKDYKKQGGDLETMPMHLIANFTSSEGRPIGKYFLMTSRWFGKMNLHNSDQTSILENYLNQKTDGKK